MLDTPQRYPRAGSQSYPSPAAEPDADGTTTVYFSPTQPAGSNGATGSRPMPRRAGLRILRLYGPLEPFFTKHGGRARSNWCREPRPAHTEQPRVRWSHTPESGQLHRSAPMRTTIISLMAWANSHPPCHGSVHIMCADERRLRAQEQYCRLRCRACGPETSTRIHDGGPGRGLYWEPSVQLVQAATGRRRRRCQASRAEARCVPPGRPEPWWGCMVRRVPQWLVTREAPGWTYTIYGGSHEANEESHRALKARDPRGGHDSSSACAYWYRPDMRRRRRGRQQHGAGKENAKPGGRPHQRAAFRTTSTSVRVRTTRRSTSSTCSR